MTKDTVRFEEGFNSIFEIDLSDILWKTSSLDCGGHTFKIDASGNLHTREVTNGSVPPVPLMHQSSPGRPDVQTTKGKWRGVPYSGEVSMVGKGDSKKIELTAEFVKGELRDIRKKSI